MPTPSSGVSRRDALRRISTAAGAVAAWPYLSDDGIETFTGIQRAAQPPRPVFLSAEQFAMTDVVAETIIPADAHSPGARAARVADYIDLLLSESPPVTQKAWISALGELDTLSRQRFGRPLPRLTAAQATALLTELSRQELNPVTPLDHFFKDAKDATIRGYYTSQLGIEQELKYQGNRILPEFVGCTHPEHGYEPRKTG